MKVFFVIAFLFSFLVVSCQNQGPDGKWYTYNPLIKNKDVVWMDIMKTKFGLADTVYVKYGCLSGDDGWYGMKDTLFIDTCFSSGGGSTDSVFVQYDCDLGILGSSWKANEDSIFIDTCFIREIDTSAFSYWDYTTAGDDTLQNNVATTGIVKINGNLEIDETTATVGQIKQVGSTIFHTYHEKGNNNIYLGQGAGNYTADSSFNIGIGNLSLSSLTLGHNNCALGYQSLSKNTVGYYNTAIGSNVLYNNIEGLGNTAIGYGALYSNGDNDGSTAIGYYSMYYADNRTVSERTTYNTAVGYFALKGSITAANNTGRYNTAIGYNSMANNTSGNYNTAIGYNTLYFNTSGSSNIALGKEAMSSNQTGSNNVAIGNLSLQKLTSGYGNTAIGNEALQEDLTGGYNIAIGYLSLEHLISGIYNVAIGTSALGGSNNMNASSNVAIGSSALSSDSIGNNNVAIGYWALQKNKIGNHNLAIGYRAGGQSLGDSNIYIGAYAGYQNITGSQKLYIDNDSTKYPLIYGDFKEDSLVINGDLTVTEIDSLPTNYVLHYNPSYGGITYDVEYWIAQYHRIDSINTSTINTWIDVKWDTLIEVETTQGYSFNADSTGFIMGCNGVSRVQGCGHWMWNGTGGSGKAYIRVLVNGDEARCLQTNDSRTNSSGDDGVLPFVGTIAHEEGDTVKVQYYVTSTNIDWEGAAVFDNPVAFSVNFEKIAQ